MAARSSYGAGYGNQQQSGQEEGGQKRRVGTRRTVDYGCTNAVWLTERLCRRSIYDEKQMRPALNEIINVPWTENSY